MTSRMRGATCWWTTARLWVGASWILVADDDNIMMLMNFVASPRHRILLSLTRSQLHSHCSQNSKSSPIYIHKLSFPQEFSQFNYHKFSSQKVYRHSYVAEYVIFDRRSDDPTKWVPPSPTHLRTVSVALHRWMGFQEINQNAARRWRMGRKEITVCWMDQDRKRTRE